MYGIKRGGVCECAKGENCDTPGKHPRIVGYFDAASRDVRTLEKWHRQWPNSNYGYSPVRNGLAALDVDERNGGLVTLAGFEGTFGKLTPTPRCNSGSGRGSFHALYKHPGKGWRLAGVLGPGIEVITRKMLVLAGGNHAGGGVYGWDDLLHPNTIGFAPFPDWALQAVGEFVGGETEGNREDRESREYGSHFSALSALSVSPAPPPPTPPSRPIPELVESQPKLDPKATPDPVALAIAATMPTHAGQRNNRLFALARHLKGIPELADADVSTLRPIVERWHAAALSVIETKLFTDTWHDFKHGWQRVRFPIGEGPLYDALAVADAATDPPEAAQYDCPVARRLVKLCRELQRRVPAGPFFLSMPKASEALGAQRKLVWKRFNMLMEDGILVLVEKNTGFRASRYRYVGTPNAKESQ